MRALHDDGDFHAAAGGVEQGRCARGVDMRKGTDESLGAVAEFTIRCDQIDHHVVVDATETHHHRGRERVERELLCAARLQARRAADDFWTRSYDERVFTDGGERSVVDVDERNRQRTEVTRDGERAHDVRRAAARGDTDHRITRAHTLAHRYFTGDLVVFRAFDRVRQ